MTFWPSEKNMNPLETSQYLIDPVFLMQMELLTLKLMKQRTQESHQILTPQNLLENYPNPPNNNAKRNRIFEGPLPQSNNIPIFQLFDPPPCSQVVKVYMIFNQNTSNHLKSHQRSLFKQEESKINNSAANQSPSILTPSIYIPAQVSKDANNQTGKVYYNPNELGLHYLKGSNNHPQTSLVQVDGQKRIVVQIKRDSNKMSNTPQNVQSNTNQQSNFQINQEHVSAPIYEGWSRNGQNGNYLSSTENIQNQGNVQQIYQNNGKPTEQPRQMSQNYSPSQKFSLVQKRTDQSQYPQKYFSFGKNQQSVSKDFNTPYKILQSNKEQSSENNEDSELKKSDVVSFKRANVGDQLPTKYTHLDDFNKQVSQKDFGERQEIERRKIEKRKKQTRQLLLGQEDSGIENNIQPRTEIISTIEAQYMGQIRENVSNTQSMTGNYESQLILSSGLSLNNHNACRLNQAQNENGFNLGFSNSIENQIQSIQSQSAGISSIPNNQNFIQNQKVNIFPNTQKQKTSQNAFIQDRFNCSNVSNLANQSQNQSFLNQEYPFFSTQVHQNQNDSIIQSSSFNYRNIPISKCEGFSNGSFPVITSSNIFEFLYYKELHRQQDYSSQTQKELNFNTQILSSQRQACSPQNFNDLFKEFEQFISQNLQSQNSSQINQSQNLVIRSFDAISQIIEAKLFTHQNNFEHQNQIFSMNDHRQRENDKKWKLNSDLPICIFIDLLYKYQCKLNQALIEQAQVLVGCKKSSYKSKFNGSLSLNLQDQPITQGLVDHISQISSRNLSTLLKSIDNQLHNKLTQIYLSIPKTSKGIKINPQTGNVEYPKKQQLSTSDLSLYQYVQNCMINYNQIVNDPLYSAYNYEQIISNSLKRLIWIKQLDRCDTKISSSQPKFEDILYNTQLRNQQSLQNVHAYPAYMTQTIMKYLDELEYLSLELDEKVNLILYGLSNTNYKPLARFYDAENSTNENHVVNFYPHSFIDQPSIQPSYLSNFRQKTQRFNHFEFYSDFDEQPFNEIISCAYLPNNYLNELKQALSFTRNIQKDISFFETEINQSPKLSKELIEGLKETKNTEHKNSSTEMIDEGKVNKFNEFISSMIKVLSGIQSNLQMMNSQLSFTLNY